MKRFSTFLLLFAVGAAPAGAMTWSINPGNSNQIVDDTGSWTITLSNFNSTFDGVAYSGKEISGVSYTENGANGIVDLTSVEADTGLRIVSIAAHKFGVSSGSNTYLKEAYLPDTIVYWGQGTFRNCTELTKVKVPTSMVRMVSDRHFGGCTSLTTVYYTGFAPVEGTVALPPCFQALSEFMFENVPMTRFYGPGVIHVERSCFPGCTLLESAEFSPNATAFMENNGGSSQSIFHNDTTYRENLKNLYPSTFCADFVTTGNNYPIPFNNASRTFKGYGWIRDTAITNYLDFSACSFDQFGEFFCYNTCIAGATIPATVTVIRNRAFNAIHNAATFRFLGPPPEFQNNNSGSQSVFYQSQQNKVGYRHTLIVDAAAYPAWTNAAKFVAVADFATNNIVNNAYGWSGTNYPEDFPTPRHPEETLGVATWGLEGNSGNGSRYTWLVQYVDHSNVTATWLNDGVEFASTTVPVGTAPTAPSGTPARASTAQYDYTFAGWNTDPAAATALDLSTLSLADDTTFHAIYSAATRSYTVTWKLDAETTIDTTTVLYGDAPTHPDASKASTSEYSYEFKGWSTNGTDVLAVPLPAVTGPVTFTAVFERHDASTTATVSWFDEDGTTPLVPAQTTVTKGEKPVHEEPAKAPTVDTAYTFAGWVEVGSDGSVTNATADLPAVSEDIAYKAAYIPSVRQYTIVFADWNGAAIKTVPLDYQTAAADVEAEKPANPTRAATAEFSYAFAGWTPAFADVTEDATYTATYSETPNVYTATFVNGETGATISSADFAYGAAVTAPDPPDVVGCHFTDWTPSIGTMPAANTTYTANYAANKYTITWKNGITGATVDTTQVYHGETPTHADVSQTASAKASYTFAGWSPEIEPAVSNTTYTATFVGTILSPMQLLYDGSSIGDGTADADVSATLVNCTAGGGEFSAGVSALVRDHVHVFETASGSAVFDATNVTATFSQLKASRGYDWTICATQWLAAANVADVAVLHGRFYAKPRKNWFSAEQAIFEDGVFRPTIPSAESQQVRLRATMTFPVIPSRVQPDATGAATGIDVWQANAGRPLAYYAWNGAKWVRLFGATAKLGQPVTLVGEIDFAIQGGTMTWYADGVQLTDEHGDWAIPMSLGPKQIRSFFFSANGGTATLGSLSGDFDVGFNGTLLMLY